MNWDKIYKLPLIDFGMGIRVVDSEGNFVFQFIINNEKVQKTILDIINGIEYPTKKNFFIYKEGKIYIKIEEEWAPIILIRGWEISLE